MSLQNFQIRGRRYREGCVSADVEVVEAEAGETEGECGGEGGGQPVRVTPVHVLIPRPVHHRVPPSTCVCEKETSAVQHSRIKVHFQATFLDLFLRVFDRAF